MSTPEEDAALHAALKADAGLVAGDAEAIRRALAESWADDVEAVAARLFPLIEPFLVSAAAGAGGPVAGAAAKLVGDAVAAELIELAPKGAAPIAGSAAQIVGDAVAAKLVEMAPKKEAAQ